MTLPGQEANYKCEPDAIDVAARRGPGGGRTGDLAGLQPKEAARVLGVTPGTLRMRLMRAPARLRKAASPDLAHGTDPASEPEVKT